MLTLARSETLWGPFESCPRNPILTNRDKAPYPIQGIGHGELILGPDEQWYVISLGFRQIGTWLPYHHLGREVFLTPGEMTHDGWFRCGRDGTTEGSYEIPISGSQGEKRLWTIENTRWDVDWCFLRNPDMARYELLKNRAVLWGSRVTLNEKASPVFIGLRQREMSGTLTCAVSADAGEAGLTLYMCEREHYDLAIRKNQTGWEAVVRLCVGDICHEQAVYPLNREKAVLEIQMEPEWYSFFLVEAGKPISLAKAQTKYLSSEVSGGFTGVVMGLYATGDNRAEFTQFRYACEPLRTITPHGFGLL